MYGCLPETAVCDETAVRGQLSGHITELRNSVRMSPLRPQSFVWMMHVARAHRSRDLGSNRSCLENARPPLDDEVIDQSSDLIELDRILVSECL